MTTPNEIKPAAPAEGLDGGRCAVRAGSAWRYHRQKCVSKWVRGNSWVTKFDDHTWCACGYNGKPLLAWMVAEPKIARQHIDEMLSPNVNVDTSPPEKTL